MNKIKKRKIKSCVVSTSIVMLGIGIVTAMFERFNSIFDIMLCVFLPNIVMIGFVLIFYILYLFFVGVDMLAEKIDKKIEKWENKK